MKAPILITSFVLSLTLLCAVPLFAAEPANYVRVTLNLPAPLMELVAEDLDGDGLKDIAAFCVSANKRSAPIRTVAVFYQDKGGSFPSNPDQAWTLDIRAAVFDVGSVSAGGKKAIGFMATDGLYAYLPEGRSYSTSPSQVVKAETVFAQPDGMNLPRWPFFVDTAGSGPEMALVPTINHLYVYTRNGAGYRQTDSLPLTVRTEFSEGMAISAEAPLTLSHRLPVVNAFGYNQPSGSDLFVTWEDNADVWLRNNGGYQDRPALSFRPGLVDRTKRDTVENASVQATDLDGDGRKDLLVTKLTGGMAQAKSLVFIYIRKKDGTFPQRPDQTIITEGVVGPDAADVNGDGRKDILLPSIKVGIRNFINMLTSKQIHMDVGVYLQDRNGRFPDSPTKEKGVDFKLDVSKLGKNSRPVMQTGRFTKTPGLGLAVVAGDNNVNVFLPDRYSVFSDNPGLKLKVDAPTEMTAVDLNGDGVDDLVMSYKKDKDHSRSVNVFLSK